MGLHGLQTSSEKTHLRGIATNFSSATIAFSLNIDSLYYPYHHYYLSLIMSMKRSSDAMSCIEDSIGKRSKFDLSCIEDSVGKYSNSSISCVKDSMGDSSISDGITSTESFPQTELLSLSQTLNRNNLEEKNLEQLTYQKTVLNWVNSCGLDQESNQEHAAQVAAQSVFTAPITLFGELIPRPHTGYHHLTIKLSQRVTWFGRHPDNHISWGAGSRDRLPDYRIPEHAMRLAWMPVVPKDIEKHKKTDMVSAGSSLVNMFQLSK